VESAVADVCCASGSPVAQTPTVIGCDGGSAPEVVLPAGGDVAPGSSGLPDATGALVPEWSSSAVSPAGRLPVLGGSGAGAVDEGVGAGEESAGRTEGCDTGASDTAAAEGAEGPCPSSSCGATEALTAGSVLVGWSSARACPATTRPITHRPNTSARPWSSRERVRDERATVGTAPALDGGIGSSSLLSECPMLFNAAPRSARLTAFSSVRHPAKWANGQGRRGGGHRQGGSAQTAR
jgi:hypothetical protein